MSTVHYGETAQSGKEARNLRTAMFNGMMGRCPNCGKGKLFRGFTKTVDDCAACGQHIDHHRADDLPAYIVIVIVGHIMVGGFMGVEQMFELSLWQHMAIWAPLTILASLALLQPVKGAIVGLQWALYMHGFGDEKDMIETHPEM